MSASINRLAALSIVLAASVSPGQAQPSGSRVHDDFGGPPYVGIEHISAARAQAIHTCGARAAQWPEYLWGNMESYQYRACMTEHRQPE
jgi:hypothetical protein